MKNLEHIQDIGAMDEVIDILRASSTFNDYGEEIIEYIQLAQVMGEFSYSKTGTETIETDQITTQYTANLAIRYFPGIDERYRIVRRSDMTDWNIARITDMGRKRFHYLTLTQAK